MCVVRDFDHGQGFSDGDLDLRLVCRAFDRAMTRVYFQHEYAKFHAWKDTAAQRLQECVIDEGAVLAPHVRRMQIKLSKTFSSGKSLFGKNIDNEDEVLRTRYGEPLNLTTLVANVSAFVVKLEAAFFRLSKLERLAITLKEEWRSEANSHVGCNDGCEEDDVEYGLVLNLDLLHLVRTNIARAFSSPRIHLPLLTHLRLTLPSVYDLATIGAHISDDVAMQLQHLYLEYIDGTGPWGDILYSRDRIGEWEEGGDNEYHPYSNLQQCFPNTDYMGHLCAFISRCHNLKSLDLRGTQCMDLDALVWRPTNTGLEKLYLSRATMTASILVSLLSPCASGSATSSIVDLKLLRVEVADGTWATVFEHLLPSPSLELLYVDDACYDRNRKSAHLATDERLMWDECRVIWSEEEQDLRSLRDLARMVAARGGDVGWILDELENEMNDD